MQLHFTPDAAEEPLELYHKLKLYGEDDPGGQASVKKPVSLLVFHSCCTKKCGANCGISHTLCTLQQAECDGRSVSVSCLQLKVVGKM